jgi:CHASE3 domain sensor protein
VTFGLLFVFGVVVATLALFAGVVWLAERKADAETKVDQHEEAVRRLRAAIEADARGRERIARGELLNDDGHRRD